MYISSDCLILRAYYEFVYHVFVYRGFFFHYSSIKIFERKKKTLHSERETTGAQHDIYIYYSNPTDDSFVLKK